MKPEVKPQVAIIMGSDSDLPVMANAAKILDELDIPYELTIVSAHRTPNKMYEYAHSAKERGLKVIIAGAGGAAHLPGMTATQRSTVSLVYQYRQKRYMVLIPYIPFVKCHREFLLQLWQLMEH